MPAHTPHFCDHHTWRNHTHIRVRQRIRRLKSVGFVWWRKWLDSVTSGIFFKNGYCFLKNWGNENRWLKVEIKNRLFSGDMPLMPYVLHSLGLGPLHSLPRYIFCHVITSYQNKMIPHLKLRVVLIFFFNKLANFLFFLILILCNL